MEELKQNIARNLQELRKRDGLTQIDLAEKLNYTDKAVSKWERGESVPDIGVLKNIADLFKVSLDYLVEAEHEAPEPQDIPASEEKDKKKTKIYNRGLITAMSIVLVWLASAIVFMLTGFIKNFPIWLPFLYAVPLSMVVWLVFNAVWFDRRRNFLIISLLMWSSLAAIFLTLLFLKIASLWTIFIPGVPGQVIIFLWSRIKK